MRVRRPGGVGPCAFLTGERPPPPEGAHMRPEGAQMRPEVARMRVEGAQMYGARSATLAPALERRIESEQALREYASQRMKRKSGLSGGTRSMCSGEDVIRPISGP